MADDNESSPELPVFSPPPIKCGDLELRLQLAETHRGYERLRAGLWDGARQVAGLHGCYVLREGEDFREVCSAAGGGIEACAAALFDAAGCPRPELKARVSDRACSAGLLFLEELRLARHLEGGSKGLDFCAAVMRCLAGPLKRVTLAICHERVQASASLERCGACAGFSRAEADGNVWLFLEPGATCARLAARTKCRSKAKAKVRGKTGSAERYKGLALRLRARPTAVKLEPDPQPGAGCPPAESSTSNGSTALKQPHADLIGGKLTPRVHYAMIFAVRQGRKTLKRDAEQFRDGVPGEHYWGCDCFPAPLRGDVYKAYVRGMTEIVAVIGALLRAGRLPAPSEVMRVLAPFTPAPGRELGLRLNKHAMSHFFGKGGKVDYILRAVIEDAMSFYEERESAEDDECDRRDFHQYYVLPHHMLDGDFDFVRSALIPEFVMGS